MLKPALVVAVLVTLRNIPLSVLSEESNSQFTELMVRGAGVVVCSPLLTGAISPNFTGEAKMPVTKLMMAMAANRSTVLFLCISSSRKAWMVS